MADISDVENGLLAILADALFALPVVTGAGAILTTSGSQGQTVTTAQTPPSGNTGLVYVTASGIGPSAADSAYTPHSVGTLPSGQQVRLYRGWPAPREQATDIAAGIAIVTIWADPALERNTTRWLYEDVAVPPAEPPTLILEATGTGYLTVNGTPALGQVCGVLVGDPGPGATAYAYRIVAGDTCPTVAAALAALVPGATSVGQIVTMPANVPFTPRVGQDTQSARLTRQQSKGVHVVIWAPSYAIRDTLQSLIDQTTLAPLRWFFLADGTPVHIGLLRGSSTDAGMQAGTWQRNLVYTCEYPTLTFTTVPGDAVRFGRGREHHVCGVEMRISTQKDDPGYVADARRYRDVRVTFNAKKPPVEWLIVAADDEADAVFYHFRESPANFLSIKMDATGTAFALQRGPQISAQYLPTGTAAAISEGDHACT